MSAFAPLVLPVIPAPRTAIEIRPATVGDLPFIDQLQKAHAKMVGWMPTKQLEEKIGAGQVLVAWSPRPQSANPGACSLEDERDMGEAPMPLGYCIGHDQYFKRDDVGIVYQMNVVPGRQRGLIGATLVKAMFERAAYGCRLFCCWCAQDIDANYFWESLGFIPLAFRAGSREKARVHIFWQRRIRAADTTTPYWFPSQTSGGAIREDRLVLPIPPGTHWRDVMPVVLPSAGVLPQDGARAPGTCLEGERKRIARATAHPPVPLTPTAPRRQRVQFGPPAVPLRSSSHPQSPAQTSAQTSADEPKPAAGAKKSMRSKRAKVKNDPVHIAAARELRDRWLERVNSDPSALPASGKYEVSKALAAPAAKELPRLPPPIAA